MSNSGLIIEERTRDIGDFLVGRLIPFRKKRMIGPFIFIDHIGPSKIGRGNYLDIGQHPHIGLSTLTYLFEGSIIHRDSIGTVQEITPGSVNWMTAGKGVVHTERTPVELRNGNEYLIHGFQIWVALPKHLEDMEPEFFHIDKSALPRWKQNDIAYTLVAGKAYGRQSPLPVYSELFMVQVNSTHRADLTTGSNLTGEIGICVVDGYIEACGTKIEKGNILVSKQEDICSIVIGADTHLLLFGGRPFKEERHIYWNFVSSDKRKIEAAKIAWREKKFEMVEGESGYIPLPR